MYGLSQLSETRACDGKYTWYVDGSDEPKITHPQECRRRRVKKVSEVRTNINQIRLKRMRRWKRQSYALAPEARKEIADNIYICVYINVDLFLLQRVCRFLPTTSKHLYIIFIKFKVTAVIVMKQQGMFFLFVPISYTQKNVVLFMYFRNLK